MMVRVTQAALLGVTLVVLIVGSALEGRAELPPCSDKEVETSIREQFSSSQQLTKSGRRVAAIENMRETAAPAAMVTAMIPAAAGYEVRYCEAGLRLDNGETVAVHVSVTGQKNDPKNKAQVQSCWDKYRASKGSCDAETAPALRRVGRPG